MSPMQLQSAAMVCIGQVAGSCSVPVIGDKILSTLHAWYGSFQPVAATAALCHVRTLVFLCVTQLGWRLRRLGPERFHRVASRVVVLVAGCHSMAACSTTTE
jgi:hypothetical protein